MKSSLVLFLLSSSVFCEAAFSQLNSETSKDCYLPTQSRNEFIFKKIECQSNGQIIKISGPQIKFNENNYNIIATLKTSEFVGCITCQGYGIIDNPNIDPETGTHLIRSSVQLETNNYFNQICQAYGLHKMVRFKIKNLFLPFQQGAYLGYDKIGSPQYYDYFLQSFNNRPLESITCQL